MPFKHKHNQCCPHTLGWTNSRELKADPFNPLAPALLATIAFSHRYICEKRAHSQHPQTQILPVADHNAFNGLHLQNARMYPKRDFRLCLNVANWYVIWEIGNNKWAGTFCVEGCCSSEGLLSKLRGGLRKSTSAFKATTIDVTETSPSTTMGLFNKIFTQIVLQQPGKLALIKFKIELVKV